MSLLVLDLASLDTPSRRRGTGRYVRELAIGLSRLPAAALGGLKLIGLTHLTANGEFSVTEDLASFAGSPEVPIPTARHHYRWAYSRRFGLHRAVQTLGADAIHLGDPHATPWLMRSTHCRRIVTCHDAIPMHFPKRYMGWRDGGPWIGAAIERHRYRSADLVVAISDATLDDVLTFHAVPRDRVVRVYNGVDVDRWSREPGIDHEATLSHFCLKDRSYALFVGGYHWHKNVDAMVAGVAQARREGVDLSLVWAGQLSEVHQRLIFATAERAGIADSLRLIGYASDEEVAVLYRHALAHTLLSRFEGFGLTVVEAMASGCPVITTRAGSLGEIAGDAAITVDPEDHEAVGRALSTLAAHEDVRNDYVRRGKARAQAFSLDVQARNMIAVYRNFLGC